MSEDTQLPTPVIVEVVQAVPCKICKEGMLGLQWTRNVVLGKIAVEKMAKHYKLDVAEVMEHINKHEIKKLDDGTLFSDDFIFNELLLVLSGMKKYFDQVIESDIEASPQLIMMITRLVREIRETLLSIATLQGRIGAGQSNERIKIMEQRVLNITNVILQDTCPECREKIVRLIESESLIVADQ